MEQVLDVATWYLTHLHVVLGAAFVFDVICWVLIIFVWRRYKRKRSAQA